MREDAKLLLELHFHAHSYTEITAMDTPYDLQMCVGTFQHCPALFRWRWNDFFDWTDASQDPRKAGR